MHVRAHPIYGAPLALALHLSTVQHEHSNKWLYQHAKQIPQSIAYLYTRHGGSTELAPPAALED